MDGVLAFLEKSYALGREEKIRGDIGGLGTFRVKLGLTEHTPPRMTGLEEGEMSLLMKEPLGTRTIRMAFQKIDGE